MLRCTLLLASIEWGCAVQIAAAINVGNQKFVVTQTQTLYVYNFVPSLCLSLLCFSPYRNLCSGIYVALILSHGIICSLGTDILARLQNLYILLNLW